MLKELGVNNIMIFPPEQQLQFAAGLNILVGENGTDKTLLMKAIYSLTATSEEDSCKQNHPSVQAYLKKYMQINY